MGPSTAQTALALWRGSLRRKREEEKEEKEERKAKEARRKEEQNQRHWAEIKEAEERILWQVLQECESSSEAFERGALAYEEWLQTLGEKRKQNNIAEGGGSSSNTGGGGAMGSGNHRGSA